MASVPLPRTRAAFHGSTDLVATSPAFRRAIEDQIEFLIGLLDGIDGDPDLEPCADVDGEDDALRLPHPAYGVDQSRWPHPHEPIWPGDYRN